MPVFPCLTLQMLARPFATDKVSVRNAQTGSDYDETRQTRAQYILSVSGMLHPQAQQAVHVSQGGQSRHESLLLACYTMCVGRWLRCLQKNLVAMLHLQ